MLSMKNRRIINGLKMVSVLLTVTWTLKLSIRKQKGAILFIGDGMGPTTVTAGRILDGQLNSRSLRRAQMGNGVHFVFFIDFVLLKGAESKTID